jgi:transposase
MARVTMIGMDLAKYVFHIYGVDERGKQIMRKKLSRAKVLEFFANLPACRIGVEACCGANYWARKIEELGHEVKMISPQYVKPYVKTNKNDYNDAEAICEALSRPNMRFVPMKSREQQDIQMIHRLLERLKSDRTATANQARSYLLENGIALPKGINRIRKGLPVLIEDLENELSIITRDCLSNLYAHLLYLDERIAEYDHRLSVIAKQSEHCQRLLKIDGVGVLVATAIFAAAGNGSEFKNGRHFAAWLGLVPRQHSTGGRTRLLGISKHGNKHLRTLLILGAHSVVHRCGKKGDKASKWLQGVLERGGGNKAAVAQANKTARIVWAILTSGEEYKKAA